MSELDAKLREFSRLNRISGKGPLSVVVSITRMVSQMDFPIESEALLTDKGGQVKGLGRGTVQSILKDYGIDRILSEEGGRTSRGSINNMRSYVEFLNSLHSANQLDIAFIENWWVERIKEFFAGQPLKFRLDGSKSIRSAVRDLTEQALKRQKNTRGTMVVGALLEHLVGAKLEMVLPSQMISHKGFSVADTPSQRAGDFVLGDAAIHVTTAPTEALVRKCKANLDAGLRPVVITDGKGVDVMEGLASNLGLGRRIDIFEVEQFVASNIYEISKFTNEKQKVTLIQLVEKYNEIVNQCETDPSLKIEVPNA